MQIRLPAVLALLGVALPSRHLAAHWDLAWTGFDLALAAALLATAWAAWHGRSWLSPVAAIAGTLLVADAWFDVLTASTTTEREVAAAMAVVAELPLAVLCF